MADDSDIIAAIMNGITVPTNHGQLFQWNDSNTPPVRLMQYPRIGQHISRFEDRK